MNSDRPSILVTGFGPFGDIADNPSAALARALDGTVVGGRVIRGLVLPVAARPALRRVQAWARRHGRPAALLALGVAATRPDFCLETTAWNEADYPIPDAAGTLLRGPISRRAPVHRQTTAPVAALLPLLAPAGPARLSTDPGRYVCNDFYFRLLRSEPAALFLHVPATAAEAPAFPTTLPAILALAASLLPQGTYGKNPDHVNL